MEPPGTGIFGLSLTARVIVALVVAAVIIGAAVQLGMVFLTLAPPNTLSEQNAKAIDDYVYPEFEQNWQLFAPNPLQDNIDVQARAQVRLPDGETQTTGWVDLTAMDDAKILHDPFPSHTEQNELRRAWDFFTGSHDARNRPIGLRGTLSQEYILRLVARRFGPRLNGGAVERVQVRGVTTPVGSPPWSKQRTNTATSYSVIPWWSVTAKDFT